MTRITHIGVVGMMVLASLAFMLSPYSPVQVTDNASAAPYYSGLEKTWDAAGDAQASAPASWSPVGALAAGDNVTFDATSVTNCDWNVEITLGNFSMLIGYTGTVTQSVDFGCVDFTLDQGTFTGGTPTYWLTCEGNFTITAPGVHTDLSLLLKMIGDSTTLSLITNRGITALEITGSTTLVVPPAYMYHLDVSGTLSINNLVYVYVRLYYPTADYTYSNTGTITGDGTLGIFVRYSDVTIDFGTVNSIVRVTNVAATESRTLSLESDTVLGGTLSVISTHATYTVTLSHGDNYSLDVTGAVTLGTRAVMTQGTGAWSFDSYTQSGASSVFNQGATLTIGTDFTVSAGVFNALGDMTVPGNWNTATGDYANDDNVVTLTGASKTLAMHADDSFYNVTIAEGASYTMDTDTNVRLRATITGELLGTGDFIEPLPEFTSTPWLKACPETLYDYEVTQTYWDILALDSAPYWLNLYDGSLKGIPGENETGIYNISLTLTWNDMVTYQNFTLVVCAEEISPYQFASFELAICLVFCFGIMLAGFKEKVLMLLAGFVWIACGVAIYIDYGDLFMYMSIGLGSVLLIKGAIDLAD